MGNVKTINNFDLIKIRIECEKQWETQHMHSWCNFV